MNKNEPARLKFPPPGTPRKGINPLTGKPRGPTRLRPGTGSFAVINPPERHNEDEPPAK
jgi:hypothetical protein